jgi:signal transduction histidine kinase
VTPTRSLRSRLSWSATLVVALWVALLTVGANLLLGVALSRQADGVLRARGVAVPATVQPGSAAHPLVVDGRGDAALDAGTWIFAADGTVVEAPPGSSREADREAAGLATRAEAVETVDVGLPDRTRLLALPVRAGAGRIATVVTSTSLAPYEELERLAGIGSAVVGILLMVVVHQALRANVSRALRPVREMTGQAGEWSAEHVDRRFGEAPRPVELDELARTLDGVLDRLGAVLRHERQLSEELSHELRTPLARVQAEVDLLRGRDRDPEEQERALAAIDEAAEAMRGILETLMAAARTATGRAPGRCAPADVLGPLLSRAAAARHGLEATCRIPSELVVGVDPAVLERIVAPVVDNAVRFAAHRVCIEGRQRAGAVSLTVVDDGPGVAPEHADQVFDPGWRAEPDDGHDGAGLGLALARRLATAAGGRISVVPGESGGRFAVDLPAG